MFVKDKWGEPLSGLNPLQIYENLLDPGATEYVDPSYGTRVVDAVQADALHWYALKSFFAFGPPDRLIPGNLKCRLTFPIRIPQRENLALL